jgi:hypothetical protein
MKKHKSIFSFHLIGQEEKNMLIYHNEANGKRVEEGGDVVTSLYEVIIHLSNKLSLWFTLLLYY